jgi:hypothetical protein
VGPRAGLDDVENRKFLTLSGLEFQPLVHPARRQSLYRLPFPGSVVMTVQEHFIAVCRGDAQLFKFLLPPYSLTRLCLCIHSLKFSSPADWGGGL